MKKILIVALFVSLLIAGAAYGAFSSYDSVTGYATVEQSIYLDIMGSSNDDNYTLSDVNQGETKYSPKIKIKNDADVPIEVNLTVCCNSEDVAISIVNDNQSGSLPNPLSVPVKNMYFYVKHEFDSAAELKDHIFLISIQP